MSAGNLPPVHADAAAGAQGAQIAKDEIGGAHNSGTGSGFKRPGHAEQLRAVPRTHRVHAGPGRPTAGDISGSGQAPPALKYPASGRPADWGLPPETFALFPLSASARTMIFTQAGVTPVLNRFSSQMAPSSPISHACGARFLGPRARAWVPFRTWPRARSALLL